MRLSRCKDENHVNRRLFQGFQQRVERLLRQHVNFVDDVDFEITACRCEADIVSKFANLIDAIVAGTVDFQYVEADTLGDLPAGVADSTRIDGWAMNAVQSLGQDPGNRSFTSSARADKKVGVSNTLLLNRIFQRLNDVILAEDVVEYLGPIFSREDLVTHADNVVFCSRRGQDLKVLRFGFWVYRASAYIQNAKPKAIFPACVISVCCSGLAFSRSQHFAGSSLSSTDQRISSRARKSR